MKIALPLVALALAASPALAQDSFQDEARPALSLEQQMLVRCSVALAIAADEQARGVSTGNYPPLAVRGKEYFVQSSARLMDELHLTREQVQALMTAEAEAFRARSAQADGKSYLAEVLPPCLSALEASGL